MVIATLMQAGEKASLVEAPTYEQARQFQDNFVWQKLDKVTVEEAISHWLTTLNLKTMVVYRSIMRKLIEFRLINPFMSLQSFSLTNHEAVIDQIKLVVEWSECTRQTRAACYVSFTGFLCRRLQGVVKKALPNKEGNAKTFFRVRDKVKTQAMSQAQWLLFFQELQKINSRDCLIAKIILQGGKRVQEVLDLKSDQIDWGLSEITFLQSKSKGLLKETVITYSQGIMRDLKEYLGEKSGLVFTTKKGKPLRRLQLAITYAKAGKAARIPFKVTPHVLRASAVTYLKQQGFPDSDIMRVTGHASSAMIYAYDKSSRSDNASKKVNLIN